MGVVTQTQTREQLSQNSTSTMDAIRKEMQSLKAETDGLYATIQKFEDATKEYNRQADQADTVTRLANKSKEADSVLKKAKVFESKCMNNEVTIEEYDNNLKSIEEELQIVGENMKQLEKSAEKAVERE